MIPFYNTFELFNMNISSILMYHYDMKVDDRLSFKRYLQSIYPECNVDSKYLTDSPLDISVEEFEKHLAIWKLQQ